MPTIVAGEEWFPEIQLVELQKALKTQGEEIGVEIKTQHQDIFDVMHKI